MIPNHLRKLKPRCCRHWLLDVADNLPGNWMLHGLDIVSDSFPAKEYLPVNVFLSIRDVFEELPEHLVEKFDVVHIRAFGLVVKGGDPNHLCANLIRMLSKCPPDPRLT